MAVNELGRKRASAAGVEQSHRSLLLCGAPMAVTTWLPHQHLHNNEHRRAVLDRLTTNQENKE